MTTAEIIDELQNYKILKAQIEELKIKLQELSLISAVDNSIPKTGITYKYNSNTENIALKRTEYENKIKILTLQIQRIENALNALSDVERKIIELKYIEQLTWRNVVYETGKSRIACYRISQQALKHIKAILEVNDTKMIQK